VRRLKQLILAVGVVALMSTGPAAFADHGGHGKGKGKDHGKQAAAKVFTLTPSTHGNPEGIAAGSGRTFFVGTVTDGTIYSGTTNSPTVTEFIVGGTGKMATGMKVSRGLLYVAGAATGKITVYNIATKQQVAQFDTGAGGFLNDLVVTRNGDVFVTDSMRPVLWHVTAAQVQAGSGTPEQISVAPEITFTTGFNLNGIVARNGGKRLIVVQSNTGKLFRIDLGSTAASRKITQVDAPALPGGDGLLIDGGRLLVVQGSPAQVSVLKLKSGSSRATLDRTITDPTLKGPSTIARVGKLLLVVNADFATSTQPFTVSGLPRKAEHGDDD
jgi:sugar lactone lactonase YvrE